MIIDEPKYYSQFGEDYLIHKFFGNKKDGFFLDIGAFDGVFLSNTYMLEQLGWKGICVEPNPVIFEFLEEQRPDSINVQKACVGDNDTKSITLNADPTGLFTSVQKVDKDHDMEQIYSKLGMDYKTDELTVEAGTINGIIESAGHEGKIDFISIDTEGNEAGILKSFDFEKYRPELLIIEANNADAEQEIKNIMLGKGYYFIRKRVVNLFFCRDRDKAELFGALKIKCKIENVMHPLGPEYTFPEKRGPVIIDEAKEEQLNHLKEVIKAKDAHLKGFSEGLERHINVIAQNNQIIGEKQMVLEQKQELIDELRLKVHERQEEIDKQKKTI
ncbi:MAG: FkbM family methyltransferase, partial [Candidatus Kapaibacterium sp.]